MFPPKFLTPFLVSTLSVSACSPTLNFQTGIDPHVALDATVLLDPSFISGQGSVLFVSPVSDQTESIQVNLAVSIPDSASITLHTFANSDLDGGLDLLLSRSGLAYQASIASNGTTEDISAYFADLSLSAAMTLSIDIHNGVTPARVVIWNTESKDPGDALFDSKTSGISAPGNGLGKFFGLTLNQSLVTVSHIGEARISP